MTAAQPIVEFRDVTKRYGDVPLVLATLNLTVHRGDFISLIGPSGCGKSTLLKLIAGLNPPTTGELTVLGATPRAARDRQAFIFQDATLLPWLTVRKNAELLLRLRGEPETGRRRKAAALLELVGLSHALDYYPRQLSGGMRMRVSIARALSVAPELLLLDEPFGALDEMSRFRLNEELLALRTRTPFSALFVTHSVAEAVFLSNRIVVMGAHPGRIAAEVSVDFGVVRTRELRAERGFQEKVNEVTRLLHGVEEHAV
jgi:NitT/TauT family transport system ATP-binding protein